MPDRSGSAMTIKVLSGVLALILWAVVTWERPAERRFSVPLRLVNLPAGLMATGSVPQAVDVIVSGPRLPVMLLASGSIALDLDLAGAGEGVTTFPGLDRRLTLPDNLRVVRISPALIEVRLAKQAKP